MSTAITLILVLAGALWALRTLRSPKRSSSCCNCSGCPQSGSCHQ